MASFFFYDTVLLRIALHKETAMSGLLIELAKISWRPAGLHVAVMRLKIEGYNIRILYSENQIDTAIYRSIEFIDSCGAVFNIELPRKHHITEIPVKPVSIIRRQGVITGTKSTHELHTVIKKLMQDA